MISKVQKRDQPKPQTLHQKKKTSYEYAVMVAAGQLPGLRDRERVGHESGRGAPPPHLGRSHRAVEDRGRPLPRGILSFLQIPRVLQH